MNSVGFQTTFSVLKMSDNSKVFSRRQPVEEEHKSGGSLTTQAKEYAESTSIHGIKYISEDGRHLCER